MNGKRISAQNLLLSLLKLLAERLVRYGSDRAGEMNKHLSSIPHSSNGSSGTPCRNLTKKRKSVSGRLATLPYRKQPCTLCNDWEDSTSCMWRTSSSVIEKDSWAAISFARPASTDAGQITRGQNPASSQSPKGISAQFAAAAM